MTNEVSDRLAGMRTMMQLARARHHLAMRALFETWTMDFGAGEARDMMNQVEQVLKAQEQGYQEAVNKR